MRISGIWVVCALLGALSTTACANMAKLEKTATAGLAQAQTIQKQVDAAKKGDVSAAGDVALSSSVKGAIEKDEKLRNAGIEVEAKGGVVHLKGKVAPDLKAHAEKVAKGVPGVTKVSNDLNGGAKAADAKDKDAKDPAAGDRKAAADGKSGGGDRKAAAGK